MSRRTTVFVVAGLAAIALLWWLLAPVLPGAPMESLTGSRQSAVTALQPGQRWHDSLRDGLQPAAALGPALVIVPRGSFWMGSAASADARASDQYASEMPAHRVTIANTLAVAQTETTVAEFRRFVEHSGYRIPPGCWYHSADQQWVLDPVASWRSPGYAQTDDHPVSCLNWADATAYAAWLSAQTGARYRLPSEAEFEYFSRAGMAGEYSFDASGQCDAVNGAGAETRLPYANHCRDDYVHASPVRSFPANAFGLYDTTGNLWEFTADCWNTDYAGGWRTFFTAAPADGSAWTRGNCRLHAIRGGSFLSSPANLRAARREPDSGRLRLNRTGVRLVREW